MVPAPAGPGGRRKRGASDACPTVPKVALTYTTKEGLNITLVGRLETGGSFGTSGTPPRPRRGRCLSASVAVEMAAMWVALAKMTTTVVAMPHHVRPAPLGRLIKTG